MKRRLDRILRIRELLEEVAELEFAQVVSEVQRLETASSDQGKLSQQSRAEALVSLAVREPESRRWMTALSDAEIFRWKQQRLGLLALARQPSLESAREEFLTRRRERRQIEALLAAADRAEWVERSRREQKGLDDWFQTRATLKKDSR